MNYDEAQGIAQKWKHRLDWVTYLNEQYLYVTPDDWKEIKEMGEVLDTHLPEAVKVARRLHDQTMTGTLGNLLATPVIVDAEQAQQQQSRFTTQQQESAK